MINNLQKNIKNKGFFASNQKIFTEKELSTLTIYIDELFELNKESLDNSSNAPVIQHLYGRNKKIDYFLEKIVTNNEFKLAFESILGKNYKIWEVSCRNSMGFDKGLELHSDGKGQMNFVLYLNDQKKPQGVTSLWPRSHLIHRLSDFTSWRNMIFIWKYFTKPLTAEKGSHFFFLNKTWHGRLAKKNQNITKALFLSGFSEGSTMYPIKGSEKYISNVTHIELKRILILDEGIHNTKEGTFYINFSDKKNNDVPYALYIEKFNILNIIKTADQYLLLIILELILIIPYRIYRLRNLKFIKNLFNK